MLRKYFIINKLLLFRIWEIFKIMPQKNWILTRTACLGNDSLALLNNKKYKILNFQKLRIDIFIDYLLGKTSKINFHPLTFIKRQDIKYLFLQQKLFSIFSLFPPTYFIIDSYSELTDQKFISKKNPNNLFNLNYSDIDNSILDTYVCEGLMQNQDMKLYYETFFNLIKKRYPKIKIIYIFFPDLLETRQKFIERHKAIKTAVVNCAKTQSDIVLIDIPLDKIYKHVDDDFPYHYSNETYIYVSNILNKIIT